MTTFINAVLNTPTYSETTNGMAQLDSSMSAIVDLFFAIGASRGKDVSVLFEKALQENAEVALRILQWSRDARGGAGERKIFRDLLVFLEANYPDYIRETRLLLNVPVLGRWDDLLVFQTAEMKARAYALIRDALNGANGLCAKWMPRQGDIAIELRSFLGLSPKDYRKLLVRLTNVVETPMCAREFESIDFSKIPSLALSRYTKAFAKKTPETFAAYKESLTKGKTKINAGAVYPYDVIKQLNASADTVIADQMWKALPNYMTDANVLPLVDVSGSMICSVGGNPNLTCLDVAVSLGLYCSDKNTGVFKDLMLTFSAKPKFVHLNGTLSQKIRQMIDTADWAMNTDLEAALIKILDVAKKNKVSQEEMPKILLILSDMQFDAATRGYSLYDKKNINPTSYEMARALYIEAGYTMPNVVYWNLNAHSGAPVSFIENGTALISGFSPSIMKSVLAADQTKLSPLGIVLETVMVDKYAL